MYVYAYFSFFLRAGIIVVFSVKKSSIYFSAQQHYDAVELFLLSHITFDVLAV